MSCRYKDQCPSYSGWCEGPKQDFSRCVAFLITAYENEKYRRTSQITANDFAQRMADISLEYAGDPEKLHGEMDDLMCETLEKLGYSEGVDIFLKTEKYYA